MQIVIASNSCRQAKINSHPWGDRISNRFVGGKHADGLNPSIILLVGEWRTDGCLEDACRMYEGMGAEVYEVIGCVGGSDELVVRQ